MRVTLTQIPSNIVEDVQCICKIPLLFISTLRENFFFGYIIVAGT